MSWWTHRMNYRSKEIGARSSTLEPLESRTLLSATLVDGTLRIDGTPGDDRIVVSAGVELGQVVAEGTVFDGVGTIRIRAGAGDDDVRLAEDLLTVDGRFIRALVRGGPGNDLIKAGSGNDWLHGGTGNDELIGGPGDDKILGWDGDDRLDGGDGENQMDGGIGEDTLLSRSDADRVRYSSKDQLVQGNSSKPLSRLMSDYQLRQWLIERGLEQWDALNSQEAYPPHWFRGGVPVAFGQPEDILRNEPASDTSPDFSETNTQVQGVDEADIVKTDGNYLYLLSNGELVIVDVWSPEEMEVNSRTPIDGTVQSLYLHDDRVTVLSHVYKSPIWKGEVDIVTSRMVPIVAGPKVKVTVLDVSNPDQPSVIREIELDGHLVSSRTVDQFVYLVLENYFDLVRPLLVDAVVSADDYTSVQNNFGNTAWPGMPGDVNDDGIVSADDYVSVQANFGKVEDGTESQIRLETKQEYRQRLENVPLVELLPGFTAMIANETGDELVSGALVRAPDIYVPRVPTNQQMTTVISINVSEDEVAVGKMTSVVGVGGLVYASAEHLYVVSVNWSTPWDTEPQSTIYQFSIDGLDVDLLATGTVAGQALNQFSMDEYDGRFRIATTVWTSTRNNHLFILEAKEDRLETVGSVNRLAPTETIRSVRFMGDRAFVVTFRLVDPLFTLDVSDPEDPKVLGELKVTGFSTYLHPLGETHLIGFGHDADPVTGRVNGMQLSLFDVSDMNDPKLDDVFKFATETDAAGSIALNDHHAFSYFPEHEILALPVQEGFWWRGIEGPSFGLMVFQVSVETGIELIGQIEHMTPVLRSLRIDDNIYSMSESIIRAHVIDDPDDLLGQVKLRSPGLGPGADKTDTPDTNPTQRLDLGQINIAAAKRIPSGK